MRLFLTYVMVGLLFTLAGCSSPEDLVKVNTTKPMQKQLGAPPTVPLPVFRELTKELEDQTQAKAEQKAEQAAAEQRAISKAVSSTKREYTTKLTDLQQDLEAKLASYSEDSEAKAAAALAELNALRTEALRMKARTDAIDAAGQAKADQLRSLINFGLNEIAPAAAAAFPGVGLALPIITGLAGLYTRKPGTSQVVADAADRARKEEEAKTAAEKARADLLMAQLAQVQKQIDAAYDQGASEARRNMREGVIVGAIKPAAVPA